MNDVNPLAALLAQSERQRDLALADQQKAQSDSDGAAAQVAQLREYRRDYERRWSAQFCKEGQIQLVLCYQGFMTRLSEAVDQQTLTAELAAVRLEQAIVAVRGHELQLASVRRLVERRLAERRGEAQRADQKQNDELAARMAWSRLTAARSNEA
ncbi:MAG: flagellar FliJ family protein [Caldimonas sp.]